MFAGALMAISAWAIGWTLWQLRRDAIGQAQNEIGNIATVLARQVDYSTQAIDLVLEDIQTSVGRLNAETPEDFDRQMRDARQSAFLQERLARLPQGDAINVTDRNGRIIASTRSWPAPNIGVSDRDYFTWQRDSVVAGLYVGQPDFSKVTGEWSMFFSRRLENAKGEFLGVVMAGARPSAFMRV